MGALIADNLGYLPVASPLQLAPPSSSSVLREQLGLKQAAQTLSPEWLCSGIYSAHVAGHVQSKGEHHCIGSDSPGSSLVSLAETVL